MRKIIVSLGILIMFGAMSFCAARIQPSDFTYLGAFRLPDSPDVPQNYNWTWNGWPSAMTFYPQGDPAGDKNGFPGSIFGVGHGHAQCVSEIAIPVPVISAGKNLDDLNTAGTLQPFSDVKGGLFGELELARVGLTYLPAQGAQTSGKLYFAMANHMGDGQANPSHGWCELTLSNPQSKGLWRIGNYVNYVTGDYLFSIPKAWADVYASGRYLGTGRMRDGGQGAKGPSVFAIAPWAEGNPPANGATISATPILLYQNVYDSENSASLDNYHHSDEWAGAVWITMGEASAMIFAGTKGQGNCWYGWADGTVYSPESDIEGEGERGWWSTSFQAQIIFYDTDELGQAALGNRAVSSVQPYAVMPIDEYLYRVSSSSQLKNRVGAIAFDEQNGLLYMFEPMVDNEKSIVHVWRVTTSARSYIAGGTPVPGDYDGDGKDNVAVYKEVAGAWVICSSSDDSIDTTYYGGSGYAAIPADYDGDGKADVAVYHEVSGFWHVLLSGSGYSSASLKFGAPGYTAIPADYDGDGKADIAVYHEASGFWHVLLSGSGYSSASLKFGEPGYTAIPADYDGDGKADIAVYHEASGFWYVLLSSNGYALSSLQLGGSGYVPAPGDYNGDGSTELGVYNSSAGYWSAKKLDGTVVVAIE